MHFVKTIALSGLMFIVALSATPASATATSYPLTLQNCGVEVTFEKAPERAIAQANEAKQILSRGSSGTA